MLDPNLNAQELRELAASKPKEVVQHRYTPKDLFLELAATHWKEARLHPSLPLWKEEDFTFGLAVELANIGTWVSELLAKLDVSAQVQFSLLCIERVLPALAELGIVSPETTSALNLANKWANDETTLVLQNPELVISHHDASRCLQSAAEALCQSIGVGQYNNSFTFIPAESTARAAAHLSAASRNESEEDVLAYLLERRWQLAMLENGGK